MAITAFVPFASPAAAANVNSLGLRATYNVDASFNWRTRAVSVTTIADVTNTTAAPVSALAFNLAPLRIGRAVVTSVAADGRNASFAIDDQTVVVSLAQPLAVGASTRVTIRYTAQLSSKPAGDKWQFARLKGVMTAYRWIPWLSRTVAFERPSVGEPWVTPTSPYVRVSISTDRPLTIATSGRRVSSDGLTQTFEATNVRDFNLSAAQDYRTRTRTVRGTTITFFYRSLTASKVLDWTAASFNEYSALVGAYPYPQFTVAEVGPWAAIESPSLIWLPSDLGAGQLPWIVSHEVAHQWFYGVVGNDQALEPFADEAVSDFMARDFVSRWAKSQCPPDDLDQSIYELGSCYPWVIYVQGARYLRNYRNRVGSADFWAGLASYYAGHVHQLGGTRALLDELDAAAGNSYPHHERFPRLYP